MPKLSKNVKNYAIEYTIYWIFVNKTFGLKFPQLWKVWSHYLTEKSLGMPLFCEEEGRDEVGKVCCCLGSIPTFPVGLTGGGGTGTPKIKS